MQWLETLVIASHVVVAVGLVAIILMQRGKGADMGAAFGGGASQTVFGSQGSGNFLTKMTTVLGILFFVTSFSLAVFAKQKAEVAEFQGIPTVQQAPQNNAAEERGTSGAQVQSDSESTDGAADIESENGEGAQDDALPELQ
ncbi:preprotein translocase subunit SecG [Hydrocarboniclastica marina]|uniref:Protein-export membrane protein SecG n=1 Tax=Hydrocarboniclastica marina TaxID=2259620 RepID=A0A4P7XKP2_9ALTE|nr:preprotein translocase subunit SecG [Hydrocarboniclastica marina]QCF27393.1 preprotein translocase subunit SecG [Hydrocarboniclastica marina]